MSYRTVGADQELVVDCDICLESLEDGDWVSRFTTEAEAAEQADAAGWVETAVGTVCSRENLPHHRARTGQAA